MESLNSACFRSIVERNSCRHVKLQMSSSTSMYIMYIIHYLRHVSRKSYLFPEILQRDLLHGKLLNASTLHLRLQYFSTSISSIRDARILDVIALGFTSLSLKTLSIRAISVEVVSMPQKATQSFTTIPPAITLLPLFTVPVCKSASLVKNEQEPRHYCHLTASGTCRREDNSSCSCMDMFGCTIPPWLDKMEYDPTRTLLATVCLNTSTLRVSAKISSVSCNFNNKIINLSLVRFMHFTVLD